MISFHFPLKWFFDSKCLLISATNYSMKLSMRLLATPTAAGSTAGLKPAPMALLPPIPLYRRLLRTHRKHLPKEMRLLGDEYIKSEFRAHRNVENPVHIVRTLKTSCFIHIDDANGLWLADWLPDGVADVRSKARRRFMAGRENRQWEDRQDER